MLPILFLKKLVSNFFFFIETANIHVTKFLIKIQIPIF